MNYLRGSNRSSGIAHCGIALFLSIFLVFIFQNTISANEYRIIGASKTTDIEPKLKTLVKPDFLTPVLSNKDRERYKKIFALQKVGDLSKASKLIKKLDDRLLMGHVLAQKYLHPTAHRSTYIELREWLKEYAELPDARRLYKLALRRKPKNTSTPTKPKTFIEYKKSGSLLDTEMPRLPTRKLTKNQRKKLAQLQRDMRSRMRRGWPTGAKTILNESSYANLASGAEFDIYQARIAWSYYLYNKDELAYKLAAASAERSRLFVPEADWTAGLAAWRLGNIEKSSYHFSQVAQSSHLSSWLVSAGAYWAARCEIKSFRPQNASKWFKIAATFPRTFYGLLGARALGVEPVLNWKLTELNSTHIPILRENSIARRIQALIEVNQLVRAEKEIGRIDVKNSRHLAKAVLVLSQYFNIIPAQLNLGEQLSYIEEQPYDGAAFPIPSWVPSNGYTIDKALIFAFIRQESRFKPHAKSRRGARGLMQLMPQTARFIAKLEGINRIQKKELMNPHINISLGQSYLHHLITDENIGNNLFFLLAAYNAGPGNLKKWSSKTRFNDDPLLFIESIRSRETRKFIERVLANYWIYRLRLGQPMPSLDAAVSGDWPSYIAQDKD